VESFTDLDLLDELQRYHQPLAERREGGITAGEYAKAQGYTRKTARNHLKQRVADGTWYFEWCKHPQGKEMVFYKK
jgi:predicted transcriptional regulator